LIIVTIDIHAPNTEFSITAFTIQWHTFK